MNKLRPVVNTWYIATRNMKQIFILTRKNMIIIIIPIINKCECIKWNHNRGEDKGKGRGTSRVGLPRAIGPWSHGNVY